MEHPVNPISDDYTASRITELEQKVVHLESEIEDKDCQIERLRERLQEERWQNELTRQENFR